MVYNKLPSNYHLLPLTVRLTLAYGVESDGKKVTSSIKKKKWLNSTNRFKYNDTTFRQPDVGRRVLKKYPMSTNDLKSTTKKFGKYRIPKRNTYPRSGSNESKLVTPIKPVLEVSSPFKLVLENEDLIAILLSQCVRNERHSVPALGLINIQTKN